MQYKAQERASAGRGVRGRSDGMTASRNTILCEAILCERYNPMRCDVIQFKCDAKVKQCDVM
jgi:hypothetical protein